MERLRYRWWVAGTAVVVAAGAAVWVTVATGGESRDGAGPEPCEVSRLDVPGQDSGALPQAVSPSGEYTVANGDENVIRWRDGEPELIETAGQAKAVNSEGVIAGEDGRGGTAWRYTGGEVEELSAPGGGDVNVTDINETGAVVGTVRDAEAESEVADGDPVSSRGRPLLWESGETDPVELEVDQGERAWAAAVTEDGTVLGYQVENGTDEPRPWRWDGVEAGVGDRLPRLAVGAGDVEPVPVDVAGDWVLSTNAPNGYRWKLSELDNAERLRLENQSATAIDAEGGAYGLAEWNVAGRQVDDEVLPLPKLSGETEGYAAGATTVVAASDDGSTLVGSAMDDEGEARAVVWRCG